MHLLHIVLYFSVLLIKASALENFLPDQKTIERLHETRLCPAQIVTGRQNSIHCRHPDDDITADQNDYYDEDDEMDLVDGDTVGQFDLYSNETLLRCKKDLKRMLFSFEGWAQKMLDSAGKPASGILLGNLVWPGDYFQCLNTSAPATVNHTAFNSQYCVLNYNLDLNLNGGNNTKNMSLPLTIGVCVPDTCDGDMLSNLTHITKKLVTGFAGPPRMLGFECRPKTIPYDAPAIAMLIIISIFLSLACAGTMLTMYERYFPEEELNHFASRPDLTVNENESEARADGEHESDDTRVLYVGQRNLKENGPPNRWKQFLKCFCVLTNGAKILDTSNKGEFRCVHGIRFLSMSWVILGHTYAFAPNAGVSVGIAEGLYREDTLAFEGITHGVLAVDSFFLLSGFLLTYLFLREADKKNGNISWGLYYFHRYWRLTPVYAILMGFDFALTRYVADGPFWPITGNEILCSGGWWWNLLYLNNFFPDKQCMAWSWFLANDMQFYIISPLFLYALWRWPKVGFSIVTSLLVGSWICGITISWVHEFFGGLFAITAMNTTDFMVRMKDYFRLFYTKPYVRIGPYLVGVILGYILYKEKDKKTPLSLAVQAFGWFVATVLSLTVIYGFHHVDMGVAMAAFYNGFASSIFTAALAWVIFACITDRGGPVNKILSHGFFIPLSRLTYCAYLVHPIIIIGYYQSLEASLQLTSSMTATLFLGFLIMSYMAAIVISLLFEAPFMSIEKMFIKRT